MFHQKSVKFLFATNGYFLCSSFYSPFYKLAIIFRFAIITDLQLFFDIFLFNISRWIKTIFLTCIDFAQLFRFTGSLKAKKMRFKTRKRCFIGLFARTMAAIVSRRFAPCRQVATKTESGLRTYPGAQKTDTWWHIGSKLLAGWLTVGPGFFLRIHHRL